MWPSIKWPGKDTWNAFFNRLIFFLLVFCPGLENPLSDHWVTQSDCITEQIVFHSCENNSMLLLLVFTLYFPPVHVTSSFIFSPVSSVFIFLLRHQLPPTLYHLFFPVIPPPPPPACQLLRLALIVSHFHCQKWRIHRNQRWQGIPALSNGPIHRGQSVAMPESIRLPFIRNTVSAGIWRRLSWLCPVSKALFSLNLWQTTLGFKLNKHPGMFQS